MERYIALLTPLASHEKRLRVVFGISCANPCITAKFPSKIPHIGGVPVPEPGTFALIAGLGVAGMALRRRNRK